MPTTFNAPEARILVRFTFRWTDEYNWRTADTEDLSTDVQNILDHYDAAPDEHPATFLVNAEDGYGTAQLLVLLSNLGKVAEVFQWEARSYGLPFTKLTIPATFIRLSEEGGVDR